MLSVSPMKMKSRPLHKTYTPDRSGIVLMKFSSNQYLSPFAQGMEAPHFSDDMVVPNVSSELLEKSASFLPISSSALFGPLASSGQDTPKITRSLFDKLTPSGRACLYQMGCRRHDKLLPLTIDVQRLCDFLGKD